MMHASLVGFGNEIMKMSTSLPIDLLNEAVLSMEQPRNRAEQLLRTMRKTLNHDLPNQLVVLQSLVHLLQSEAVEQLSIEGQEYTQRIQNVARKASGLVRFLKEIGRLSEHNACAERVSLPTLGRELKAELTQAFPQRKLVFSWSWEVESVQIDGRLLYQSVLELIQARLEQHSTGTRTIHAGSRPGDEGMEVYFIFDSTEPREGAVKKAHLRPEAPHETLLAREWLAHCDARLVLGGPNDDRFTILIPESPAHG